MSIYPERIVNKNGVPTTVYKSDGGTTPPAKSSRAAKVPAPKKSADMPSFAEFNEEIRNVKLLVVGEYDLARREALKTKIDILSHIAGSAPEDMMTMDGVIAHFFENYPEGNTYYAVADEVYVWIRKRASS